MRYCAVWCGTGGGPHTGDRTARVCVECGKGKAEGEKGRRRKREGATNDAEGNNSRVITTVGTLTVPRAAAPGRAPSSAGVYPGDAMAGNGTPT